PWTGSPGATVRPAGTTSGEDGYGLSVTEVEIKPVAYSDPVAEVLVAAAMADLAGRYGGGGDDTPVEAGQFDPPHGAFFVAYLGGEPVGCGGWRSFPGAGAPAAEIKRMYVRPVARGRGVALAVLRAVEESARGYGCERAILETGAAQPEAIN